MSRFRLSRLLLLFALLLALLLAGLVPTKSEADTSASLAAACAALAGYTHAAPSDNPGSQAKEIVRLCGGVDNVPLRLIQLLQDPNAETRLDAAAALGFRDTFLSGVIFANLPQTVQSQEALYEQQIKRYNQLAVPALSAGVQDKDDGVRLAALQALEALTWNSQNALWSAAVLPVSQAAASPDTVLHLPALRVLAYMPADVSPAASSLRLGLHGTADEQSYALAALIHAGQTNRTVTLNAFLPDLASHFLAQRRQAIDDISQAVVPLWTSDFIMHYPLPNWNGDSRLSGQFDQWFFHLAPQSHKEQQAAMTEAQARLLAALIKAASDPDHLLRYDAALSLEQIGNWTVNGLGWSIIPNSAHDTKPEVQQALVQAASSLKKSEPILARRLQELHAKIEKGPGVVF